MSSTCLSGGSSPYRIDLEMVKCTSTCTTTTTTTRTSSPSSTLSESSSVAISTRKPRAPRKRPNQTYNEAAALLSSAYPNIFSSSKPTTTTTKFSSPHHTRATPQLLLDDSSSELLLLPCRVLEYYNSGFLLHQPACSFFMEPKTTSLMMSPKPSTSSSSSSGGGSWEVDSHENSMEICDGYREEDDFDAESILLDEEELIGEGIDSIMGGNLTVLDAPTHNNNNNNSNSSSWYGNNNSKLNLGVRALKRVSHLPLPFPFPVVDVLQISPRLNSHSQVSNLELKPATNPAGVEKKKKKKKSKGIVDEDPIVEDLIVPKDEEEEEEEEKAKSGLLHLKLDYEGVLNAWSDDRGAPIPQRISCANGNHISARLAQIDLFSESGVREASVLRYKEKRRSRLFSKKIRYQVRKLNADRRPRMKGRFVRRGNSRREE